VGTIKDGSQIKYKLTENEKIIYTCWLDQRSFDKGLINIEKEINIPKNDEFYLNNIKEVKEFVAMINHLKFNVKNSVFGPKWLPPTRQSNKVKVSENTLQNLLQIPRSKGSTRAAMNPNKVSNSKGNEGLSDNSGSFDNRSKSSLSYNYVGGLKLDANLMNELENSR